MFKYYVDIKKYDSKRTPSSIESIYLTEYYNYKVIDGTKAFYVIGSDVLGPMGKELIPFETMADASDFSKDHKGKRILRFENVSREVVKSFE